jgi:hypothetical protein
MTKKRTFAAFIVVAVLLTAAIWLRPGFHGHPGPAARSDAKPRRASSRPLTGPASAALDPKGTFEGHIVDERGEGIAGASVCAEAPDTEGIAEQSRESPCSKSGDGGRYLISDLSPGTYTVLASAAGYEPSFFWHGSTSTLVLQPEEVRQNVDVTLRRGGVEVHGHVKDVGGGPVASASVRVERAKTLSTLSPAAIARTDADGLWKAWVRPGRIEVKVAASGYADGLTEATAPGDTIETFLTPESALMGRVLEKRSQVPVGGASVSAILLEQGPPGDPARAQSDASGLFRIGKLSPGRYQIVASSEDGYGQAAESVVLGVGERSREIVIELEAAISVTGRVVDEADGKPCSAGDVRLDDSVRGIRSEASISGNGEVRLAGMRPGKFSVRVRCKGSRALGPYKKLFVTDKAM